MTGTSGATANTSLNSDIIDGDALRKKLECLLPQSKKSVTMVSAYITQSGIEWLSGLLPKAVECTIVCRLLPSDVLSGSTHVSALKTALSKGMNLFCLHSLHAKIYAIDNQTLYAGSANLTSNGLKIYGQGNLEACVEIAPNPTNLGFIGKILASATRLDLEAVTRMQACIDMKEKEIYFDHWPESVLTEDEGVWVRDFLWNKPGSNASGLEHIHDQEILSIDTFDMNFAELKNCFINTRCFKWLVKTLKANDGETFFGSLSAALHNDIVDDPTPYRKDIKILIENLLAYCEVYATNEIEINRPNHSQKIKLLMAS